MLDLAKLDLQETGAVTVGVTGPVKTRTVRLGFAKTSIRVLAFANPRVGGGWAFKNEGGEGGGGQRGRWGSNLPK